MSRILYKDLDVWRAGMSLVEQCYRATKQFPQDELFGLTNQIRRAAVSIPSNVAEGANRKSDPVYRNHIAIALGSHAELETCLEIARRLAYLAEPAFAELNAACARTGQLLNGLFRSLKPSRRRDDETTRRRDDEPTSRRADETTRRRADETTDMFHDRADGGRRLAEALARYRGNPNVIVLALPRGGVPVGLEVARALDAPLDVFVVRKLGVPGHVELAMGAIASGGVRVVSQDILRQLSIPMAAVETVTARERQELERRERLYRGDRSMPSLKDRTVILVDDGLATGATMEAAVLAVRQHQPARVVVAAPVGAPDTCDRLRRVADDVVCAATPASFRAVGSWYERFEQTSDEEVVDTLSRSAAHG